MLARTLGRTLAELGETMTAAEFADHWDDYRHAPWGDRRGDIQAAQIVQAIANYAGKMREQPAGLTDCMLDFDRDVAPAEEESDPADFFQSFMG